MILKANDIILFQGDSVTDCGRNRNDGTSQGYGYPMIVTSLLLHKYKEFNLTFYNKGISGDRVKDLENRWQEDCIDLKPTIVSILIGINDVWRRYDSNDPTSPENFERSYRNILSRIKNELNSKIIIMDPFVIPFPEDRKTWREDLDPKLEIVRGLAAEFGAVRIPLDNLFAEGFKTNPGGYYAPDGVHPSLAGHGLISHELLKVLTE